MFKPKAFLKIVGIVFAAVAFGLTASAREFALNGVTLDLREVTTNVDVYFTSLRLNRAVNEWNVNVTVSNKVNQTFSGPLVLLVDSYTGTSGPLQVDGISANQSFLDLSGQLHQGNLAPYSQSETRLMAMEYTVGESPKLVTRVYALGAETRSAALGFTRSLNEAGQPLPGVVIQETGPDGDTTNATEGDFGVVTLGKSAGDYIWKFSSPGYLPVWRRALLSSNNVAVIPYPRLARRTDSSRIISPLTGGIVSNQTVQVQIGGGSVPQDTTAQLTVLDGQSLPFFLPQGWSPLQAFSLELGADVSQAAPTTLIPWGSINQNETAALVKFNSTTLTWQVLQLVAGNGTNAVSVSLPGSGTYALVVPDSAPGAPPAATIGTALQLSLATNPDPANLTAGGVVNPAVSPASIVSELVTAIADVSVTNSAGALASGTLLHGEVSEHYLLRDGTTRMPPAFDNFIVGYQRPGNGRTDILHARFPLRPLLLFGAEKLDSGTVHVDLFSPGLFSGGILDTNGGLVADGSVRLLAGPGMMQERSAIQLQNLSLTNFTDFTETNFTVVAAFEVAVSGVRPGGQLLFQAGSLPPNQEFVLGKVIDRVGWYGVEPRERLHSDASGNLSSDEPASGVRLPGLTGAGQYLLLQVQPQQGLVSGVAKNSSGQATGGLPVSIIDQPWLTFSAADGSFKLLAPAGPAQLSLSDPARGDVGTQSITIPPNLDAVNTEISSAASDLLVTSITPTNNAVNVPFVTSVVINFNRAINPATLMGDAVQLLDASNQLVAATVSLNLANTTVTLLPGASLDPTTHFHVLLSTNIMDTIGRSLEGQNKFGFTTVALSDRDPAAQLIIYQPDATNLDASVVAALPGYVPGTNASLIVVHGTEGSADPEVPVIVVNEGSGESTTVLSKSDGSFTTFIAGREQDFISATFINLNNTRIYLPVNRQLFDDGSVGLYPQGGTLTASGDGGPIEVTIPSNAIKTRTKFKLDSISTNQLTTQLEGVVPDNGVVAGSALNLHIEGDEPTLPLQVKFPVDLAALGYPTNEAPTNAAAMVAVVKHDQDVTTFQVVDQLLFEPQTTSSSLRFGNPIIRPKGGVSAASVGALDTSLGILITTLGPAGFAAQFTFNQVLVPLLFGPRPVIVKGKVSALPYDLAVALESYKFKVQVINGVVKLVSDLNSPGIGIESVDVPYNVYKFFTSEASPLSIALQEAQLITHLTELQFEANLDKQLQPLSGAFITLSQSDGALTVVPGRLNPGMVYATSGSDGTYLMMAPAVAKNYILRATHPLYENVPTQAVNPVSTVPGQQGDLSLVGAVFKDIYFVDPSESQAAPQVNIANTPVLPGPGQACEFVISASQPGGAPTIGVHLDSVGQTNLLTGLAESDVQYSFTNFPETMVGSRSQWTGIITVDKPVVVKFRVTLIPKTGPQQSIPYEIAFTGPVPVSPGSDIPAPDTNDIHGPLVVETMPSFAGYVNQSGTITISFNKPIDASVTNRLGGINLSGVGTASATPVTPVVQLSSDQQTLILQFPGLVPDSTYQLTLSGQSIRDLVGQPLDQFPSTPATADSFTTTFHTPPAVSATLPGLANGRGVVISGTELYALDQAPQGNYLDAYDITDPLNPRRQSQIRLPGMPRDLVLMPHYSYKLNAQASVDTNDLVAVVGGDLDAQINQVQGTTVTVPGQYLWVVNMEDPALPQVLASPKVSYRVGSAVTKVRWAPPYLVYEEYGADVQLLGLVNLQELIWGYNSTAVQVLAFQDGRAGVDLNGDGDYVDSGEKIPIPPTYPTTFFGNDRNFALQGTTQKILDFSVTPGAGILGVVLKNGVTVKDNGDTTGPALPFMYRTLAFNGVPLDYSNPTNDAYSFPNGAYPRWVSVFNALPILVGTQEVTIAAALVSLEPDTNGLQTLAVLDISLPQSSHLISKITIPDSLLGGDIESVSQRPDGLLEVAGAHNLVVLNPLYLASSAPPGQLSPAIMDIIPNAGAKTRSLGTTDYGVHAVADDGRATVVLSAPQMQFVSFPRGTGLVNSQTLHQQTDEERQQIFDGLNPLPALAPANLQTNLDLHDDLNPPNIALHYYVLMFAPGGSGSEIDVGLESLNPSGRPLRNRGAGFAPVRAVSQGTQLAIGQSPLPCGAPISPLPAYRLSDDPKSQFFNYYLSRPFALVTEAVSASDLDTLNHSQFVPREILFSGAELRAFIDPDESANQVIGSFAAKIDQQRQEIYPISSAVAQTVNRDYLVGDNPPPPGGSTPFEDTYGTIQAHSGELRTSQIDMSLPSPNMPVDVVRSIGNQDDYDGPFGPGWDFNYNQRLTILDPLTFPEGLQIPLVTRDNKGDSDIAGSQDVLFNDGQGQVYHFVWKGTNMPSEYGQDPLVQAFNYQEQVSDYYLPQPGLFDLLVKFKDGRFERLASDGTRFRYTSDGRLETILDRYPKNRHDLSYDRNGWLVRIDDHSVSAPRFVEFGYYRRSTDPDFNSDLDTITDNPYWAGNISQLRDYVGRNTLYFYDNEGFLLERDGVQVDGENGGYSGRSHVYYAYQNCKLTGISYTDKGTPLVMANNTMSSSGKPVAMGAISNDRNDKFTVPAENSAATVGQETTSVKMADATKIERTFDKWGNVTTTTITGSSGSTVTEVTSNNADGLTLYAKHPLGNSETMTYDSDNAIFRSRGNLLNIQVDPGPRGGQGYTQIFHSDPRYNLPSGQQVDPNGFHNSYTLTPDGRAVQSIDFDGAGNQTMAYNDNGQITHTVDVKGVEHSLVYDSATGFTSTESSGDITVNYGYDGSIASKLGMAASMTPPAGSPTIIHYNNIPLPVEMTRGDYVSKQAYDELGRGFYHQEQIGDGKSWTSHVYYDDKGFVTNSVMNGVEVNGAVGDAISYSYTPDNRMRVKNVTFPNGSVQNNSYDERGNLITETHGDYTEEYGYDFNNNLISVKQGGDEVQRIQYDGLDRPTTMTTLTGTANYTADTTYYPGGQTKSYTLTDPDFGVVRRQTIDQIDPLGRPLSYTIHGNAFSPVYTHTYHALSSTLTGPRMSLSMSWDTAGNQTGSTDPNTTVVMGHDENGRLKRTDEQQQGANYSQIFTYDNLDHVKTMSDLFGPLYTYVPRADGSDTQVIDALGNAQTFDYTSLAEPIQSKRADGMTVITRHDADRQVIYQGDPGKGFDYKYDDDLRLAKRTLRDGSAITYNSFDSRNHPIDITISGGNQTLKYDWQGRVLQRKVAYQATSLEEDYTYDALDRVRSVSYSENGGSANSATFDFDESEPLLAAHYQEDGSDFEVDYDYYADGNVSKITYPSGVSVNEIRDTTGRMTGLSDTNGNIISAVSWQGDSQPKEVDIGSTMKVVNQYDTRGRLTASRVTRLTDGAVLLHTRYQYDAADDAVIRQFLDRGGKADEFDYDAGRRLHHAQISTVPLSASDSAVPLSDRTYNYHADGLDYLTATTSSNLTSKIPPFATNWTSHDEFLLPETVDGFDRGASDPMGNVAQAQLWARRDGAASPEPVSATLQHDGMGRLITVTRADGVVEQNYYQPSGLRYRRTISQSGSVVDDRRFVYDNAERLLETYENSSNTNELIARYYYANGDAPVAADLMNWSSGELQRYYYLKDNSQSVLAVADAAGVVVERVWYDPFGQPHIEERDTQPPQLKSITASDDGKSLLIALSEPVWTPTTDPGAGTGIVYIPMPQVTNLVSVSLNSTNVSGVIKLLPSAPGYAPYSVVQFEPNQPLTDMASALVGWWPGDANVLDVAGGHNGSLQGGATVGSGLIGQAFLLDGSAGYIKVPDTSTLNVGGADFTAALWAKFNHTNNEQVLVEKWISASRSGWSLIKMPDNRLRLALGDGAGNEMDVDSGILAIPETNWVHYAIRRQGSQFTIYTNGVAVTTGTSGFNLDAATALKFGSREGGSFFLNGSIDEVTLFSRALTTGEITAAAGGVSVPGPVTVTVHPGIVADEWGNSNTAASVSFEWNDQPGTVFYSAEPSPQTAPVELARSSVDSPFLFQGQYFDYDTGLVYMRARYYDPFSGMFCEPDPMGYEVSVNPYAGLGNDPVNARDPSGLINKWKVYDELVLASGKFSPEVVKAARAAHAELKQQGFSDHAILAVIDTMAKWSARTGKDVRLVTKLVEKDKYGVYTALRGSFGDVAKKGEEWVRKSKKGQVAEGVIPDVDGLALTVDGFVQDFDTVKRFREESNATEKGLVGIFASAQESGTKGIYKGWTKWTEGAESFQHGFTANLMEEIGLQYRKFVNGKLETAIRGKSWLNEVAGKKVPKVPEGFGITVSGGVGNTVVNLEGVVPSGRVKALLGEGQEILRNKLNSKGFKSLDLRSRMATQGIGEDFINYHPIGHTEAGYVYKGTESGLK